MTVPALHLTASSRLLVRCREYGEIDVPPDRLIRADGTLRVADEVLDQYVTCDFKGGRLRLRAKGVSGVFALTDDITVQVQPRFPLTNLTHMVSVCGYVPVALEAMREYQVTDDWQDWMLDVVTDSLLVAVDTIEELGQLRTYRRRTDSGSYPHGRVEMSATINRSAARGMNHKAVYSWWERTPDNPPNRCIRSAIQHLHRLHRARPLSGAVRPRIARLGNALRLLEEVPDDPHLKCLEDPVVRGLAQLPEARLYYRPALDLAVAVLRGQGFDLDAKTGTVAAGSLLVKTEDLFEDFVRLSLQQALSDHPELAVLDGNINPGKRPLYSAIKDAEKNRLPDHSDVSAGNEPNATPDVLFARGEQEFPLVAEVKYTNVTRYADRAELEQAMVYGVRYGSPVVLTIHPRRKNTEGGLVICGRIGEILVAQYRVDLAADDLDAEMGAMAQSLVQLIDSTS